MERVVFCVVDTTGSAGLPLFAVVGSPIAVDASPECVAAASQSLRPRDLTDVVPLLDDLVVGPGR